MVNFIKESKPLKQPDLVPMINVIFLLLCFFLIAGSIAKRDPVDITTPESRTSAPFLSKNFTVLITKEGDMMFEEQKVSMVQLATRLAPYIGKNAELPVLLKADAGLPAERLTNVIRGLQAMGVVNLSLATEGK